MEMCGKIFRIFDRIDCKISMFKVERKGFLAHCGTRFFAFEHLLTQNFCTIEFRALNIYSEELT